jgi:transcriptional regulator with XRE-family HTH domain
MVHVRRSAEGFWPEHASCLNQAGLTQAQLATRTGLTQQYVSQVEAGHQNITIDTMAAIARVIGRDVSALLRKGRNRIGQK